MIPHFDKGCLPEDGWHIYQKRLNTKAVRIRGAFCVETLEGTITCPDGYLALDAEGNPYPIARAIFERSYTEVGPVFPDSSGLRTKP